MRIFCTHCKPEYEMKHEAGALMTHCPCSNVAVLWDVFSEPPVPVKVNSFDSRWFRIEKEQHVKT